MSSQPVKPSASPLIRGGLALAAVGLSITVALLVLGVTGQLKPPKLPGLSVDVGPTTWLLPAFRVLADIAAVVTVGQLLAAVAFIPGFRREGDKRLLLSGIGLRWVRRAAWAAAAWAIISAFSIVLTASDLLGISPGHALRERILLDTARSVIQGQTLTWTCAMALLVAVVGRYARTLNTAAVTLILAVLAVTPAAFAGHASGAGNHQLAVSGQILHVVPVTLWLGGLLALVLGTRLTAADRAVAVGRFSKLAVCCLVLVGVSGLISLLPRLRGWSDLLDTGYGRVALIKITVLIAAGTLGAVHRAWCIPHLRKGTRWVFTRIAVAELAVLAVGLGAGVGLARMPAPRVENTGDAATSLLGYPMPPPVTLSRLIADWLPDPLVITAVLTAVGIYLAGYVVLRRRGDTWPAQRLVFWIAGWLVLAFVTNSGMARYAPVLFSVHMGQHMVLTMLAPILLVMGGPVTLALRALRPTSDPKLRGIREWIVEVMHHPFTRMMAHPLMALGMYAASLYAMYFTSFYDLSLRSHAVHLLMIAHLAAAGYFFFWILIGIDPPPKPIPHPVRVLLLFVSMVFHAIFGLAIMQSTQVFASDWYATLARGWGGSPLSDQRLGGAIAWAFGETPAAFVLGMIIVLWIRNDHREQRRLDKLAVLSKRSNDGSVVDPHEAYNEYLASLERRTRAAEAIDAG